jgi:hypothetical protein
VASLPFARPLSRLPLLQPCAVLLWAGSRDCPPGPWLLLVLLLLPAAAARAACFSRNLAITMELSQTVTTAHGVNQHP